MNLKKFEITDILCKATVSFSLIFSFCACTGVNMILAMLGSVLSCFLGYKSTKLEWYSFSLILLTLYLTKLGFIITLLAVVFSIILFIALNKKRYLFIKSDDSFNGISISTSFLITAFFTNQYFGIGSYGNSFIELMRNYFSLGFHPNWRGILYGTIVMVIMITIPRKFKKFGTIIFSGFIGLVVSLLLNLVLIPDSEFSPISEITKEIYISKPFDFTFCFDIKAILSIIVFGFSIYILLLNAFKDNISASKISIPLITTVFSAPILTDQNNKKFNIINNLISSLMVILIYILVYFIPRLPIASCAVIVIVSAWQSVYWKRISYSFKDIRKILKFTFIILISVLINPAIGIILTTIIY